MPIKKEASSYSIRGLGALLAQEKRRMSTPSAPVRLVVTEQGWTVLTHDFVHIVPEGTLASASGVLSGDTNTERLARELIAGVRKKPKPKSKSPLSVRPEPPLRPSELPPELEELDEDGEPIHPLIAEAREARKLRDVEWTPPEDRPDPEEPE